MTNNKNRITQKPTLPVKLALSTAIAGVMMMGYSGRKANAGSCYLSGAVGTYTCSGVVDPTNDVRELITTSSPLSITTTSNFGIDTSLTGVKEAFRLTVTGSELTFIDNYNSIIKAGNPVTGGNTIFAHNNGSGSTAITTTGTVSSTSNFHSFNEISAGVQAVNGSTAQDMNISVYNVSGSEYGLYIDNQGTGMTTLTTTGLVANTITYFDPVRFREYSAIHVENGNYSTGGMILDIQGDAYSNHTVISATNRSFTGPLKVTTSGTVTSTALTKYAAMTLTNRRGTYLTVDALGDVYGGVAGITTTNRGGGATTITTQGNVTATYDGIIARNTDVATTEVTVDIYGDVTATRTGILAENETELDGSITITTAADTTIIASTGDGIYAHNVNNKYIFPPYVPCPYFICPAPDPIGKTGGLNITMNISGDINSHIYGVNAYNNGVGVTEITLVGEVISNRGDGIRVNQSGLAEDVTITTQGNVTGGTFNGNGVHVINAISNTIITNTGTLTGRGGSLSGGIFVETSAKAGDIIINAQNEVSGNTGIKIDNDGKGALSITTTAKVTGTQSAGIYISGRETAQGITIDAQADVSGVSYGGIRVINQNESVSITTQGTVTALNDGISIRSITDATDINITANGSISSKRGINIYNAGTSYTDITTTATVTGTQFEGIYVENETSATDITINTQDVVSGHTSGIKTRNRSSGLTSISTLAAVEGTNAHGIYARTDGGNLTINNQNTVSGGVNGIGVVNDGTGLTTLTLAANVTGATDGIRIVSTSPAAVSITGTSNITGGTDVGDDGIDIAAEGVVSVDVNGTIIGDPGIVISSVNGPIDVTGTGDVTGLGGNGINTTISNVAATADITIARDGDISGADNGIISRNLGMGNNIVTTNKIITAGTGYGIRTETTAGNLSTITLNTGANVSATSGLGLYHNLGDSLTTVNTGATLAGEVRLNAGADTLTFANSDPTSVTQFDGGDDGTTTSDILNFQSTSFTGGDTIVNWETFNLQGTAFKLDSDLTMGDSGAGGLVTVDGPSSVNFTGNSPGVFTIDGDVDHTGLLTSQDPDTDDSLTITGNHIGNGGQLDLDAEFNDGIIDNTDILIINGDTSGTTTLNINNIGGIGGATGTGSTDGILVIQVSGNSAGIFTLAGGPITIGSYEYNLVQADGQNWYLQSASDITAGGTVTGIPTLNTWSLAGLSLLLMAGGLMFRSRRWKG